MASITNSFQFSIHRSQFSYLNKVPGSNLLPLKGRSVVVLRPPTKLESLPENSLSLSPVELSGNVLKFTGWSQLLRQRGSVGLPVTKAAAADFDADDVEIEISDGFELLTPLNLFIFYF